MQRRTPVTSHAVLVFVVVAGFAATGCATSGAVPRPFPTPGGPAVTSGADGADSVPTLPGRVTPPRRPPGAPALPTDELPLRDAPDAGALTGRSVANMALQFLGVPYRFGGDEPGEGFDCSGLIQYVYSRFGIQIPRDVLSQFQADLKKVKRSDIRPGDLLFFATDSRDASHVAMAINSRQFVHAPNSRGVVRVENIGSGYWKARFRGARRILDGEVVRQWAASLYPASARR